jgi:uncharacterized membrane protein
MVYCCMHETSFTPPRRKVVLMLEYVVKIDVNEFLIYFFHQPFCVGCVTLLYLSNYDNDKTSGLKTTLNGLE